MSMPEPAPRVLTMLLVVAMGWVRCGGCGKEAQLSESAPLPKNEVSALPSAPDVVKQGQAGDFGKAAHGRFHGHHFFVHAGHGFGVVEVFDFGQG